LNATNEKVLAYSIPGFFGGLVFFYMPGIAGGYRTVKWACAGLLLAALAGLLYRRLPKLYLPSNAILLSAAAVLPLCYAVALFSGETDVAISLAGILRYCVGLASALLIGSLWVCLDEKQRESTLLLLPAIAAAAAIPIIISCVEMYREGIIFEPDISGTFGNPNWAAGYLVTAIPLAVYCLKASPSYFKKGLAGVSLAAVIGGIAFSLSKTAMLTGILILFVSFLALYKKRDLVKYSIVVGVPFVLLSIILFHSTFGLWLRPRLFIWHALLITMRDSWLVGKGALQALSFLEGGLAKVINGDINSYMPASQVEFVYNDYLQAFAEGGILGFFSFLTIMLWTLRKAYLSCSTMMHAAGLSLLALSIFALGDSPLQVPVTFYAWWFLVGIIWFHDINTEVFVISNTRAVKVFILMAMVLFFTEGARSFLGIYFWTQSGRTTTLLKQKQCLKKVCLFTPETFNARTEYAQALGRSRQFREARLHATRAAAVKFDYDDMYLITQCDIALRAKDPLSAWQSIADKFPCLNYPKLQLAKFYLENRQYQLAREQCSQVINSCQSVHTNQPYNNQALRIMEMIDKLPQK